MNCNAIVTSKSYWHTFPSSALFPSLTRHSFSTPTVIVSFPFPPISFPSLSPSALFCNWIYYQITTFCHWIYCKITTLCHWVYFFDLRSLITPLVSANSSYCKIPTFCFYQLICCKITTFCHLIYSKLENPV